MADVILFLCVISPTFLFDGGKGLKLVYVIHTKLYCERYFVYEQLSPFATPGVLSLSLLSIFLTNNNVMFSLLFMITAVAVTPQKEVPMGSVSSNYSC